MPLVNLQKSTNQNAYLPTTSSIAIIINQSLLVILCFGRNFDKLTFGRLTISPNVASDTSRNGQSPSNLFSFKQTKIRHQTLFFSPN